MQFFSLGLIRGLLTGACGAGVGMVLLMLIRLIFGWSAWEAESAGTVGALFGVVAFLAGVGAFTDWWRWTQGEEAGDPHHPDPQLPQWRRYFSFDPSHKVIGVQYSVTALLIMFTAGILALLMRLELASPGMQFLSSDTYNHIMSVHGIVMIAAILSGVAGMANYLIPLMIGAPDMAFPRLNAFSYWLSLPGAILVLVSLFTGGFDTGWTGYPPLGVKAPLGAQFFYLGVFIVGLSSILGSINFLTTT
ncbi:MAG: cytochrome C oxidase subunit I, partial [Nitrospinota bacterium]